ncbi:MAG: hypothetical protein WAN04_14925 [Candidatus Udaeobacter sp.]
MKADAFPTPADVPFPKVAKFFRRHAHLFYPLSFTRSDVLTYFGKDVTNEMLKNGLIEPSRAFSPFDSKGDYEGKIIRSRYRITKLGFRLARVPLIPRLPRARAEPIVIAMLARAETINADEELLTWINRIILYGSYLGKDHTLGDIDVGVEIRYKYKLVGIDESKIAFMRECALHKAGKPWPRDASGHLDEFAEARNRLKNRERYLAITDAHYVDKLRTRRKRVIWPTLPSPWVRAADGARYFSQCVQDEIERRQPQSVNEP